MNADQLDWLTERVLGAVFESTLARVAHRARDLKVRRFTEVRANRENPGVHRTSGRAGPRGHPVRERWLCAWPANAPDPEGTPVAAPIGVSRSSTSVSRTLAHLTYCHPRQSGAKLFYGQPAREYRRTNRFRRSFPC